MREKIYKVFLNLIILVIAIAIFQTNSFASSNHVQMLKLGETEYLLYVENWNKEFEFAFSNKINADKTILEFKD